MTKASGWHRKDKNTASERARNEKYRSAEHKAARAHYRNLLERGVPLYCWRPGCGKRLVLGQTHVGHDDVQVNVIRGPECQECNRSHAGSKGARVANAARKLAKFQRPAR